jgi:hypothetical protein
MNLPSVYKSHTLLLFALLSVLFSAAQKKVIPVTQSSLSGMSLPNGTKQDSRFLTEISAKTLFEMETKKAGTTVSKVEVLNLPAEAGFTADSLVTNLQTLGFTILPLETDNKYAWLQKSNRYLVLYFEMKKTGVELYFGELGAAPTAFLNSNPQTQPATQEQQTTTQQTTTEQQTNTQQQTTTHQQTQPEQQPITNNQQNAPVNSGYAFTSTNFDDGWVSTVQEDWVEVVKGTIKVLLHYPKEGTIIPADPEPHVNNAWNILTAPRYSNLRNYRTAYVQTFNRPYLGMGTLTDNTTGRDVFVVLFRQGQSGWMEFIMPDKNDFIQQYKFDPETIAWNSESELMNSLTAMGNYNKFAVAASDFNGTWTSDFTGMQQLYNVYTGNYAGMNINQSKEVFEFSSGGNYKWNLLVVNGMVGAMNYAQVKSTGKLQLLNNWQVSCTDIEGKPKKYHAFFSCIKGARLLKLLDADYPGSGIPTVFGRK